MTTAETDDDLAYVQTSMGDDLDTMLVFNLLRTNSFLGTSLDAGLRDKNLTAAQFNTLLVLRQAGSKGLLMSEIGERLVVTKSNMTGKIDRLEALGLVARSDLKDRRATAVRLTRAGETLLDKLLPKHAALLTELTGCLNQGEKETLIKLLNKLRRELRSHRQGGSR